MGGGGRLSGATSQLQASGATVFLSGGIKLVGSGITITQNAVTNEITFTGGAGSGANATLSNLTSPTAINQDLIFNKASPLIKNQDNATTGITLLTGAGTSASSTTMTVSTGAATGGGNSTGALTLSTGNSASAASGDINLTTGTAGTTRGSINATANAMTFTATVGDFLFLPGTSFLEVRRNQNGLTYMQLTNTTSGTAAYVSFFFAAGGVTGDLRACSPAFTAVASQASRVVINAGTAATGLTLSAQAGAGNVLLQSGGFTTRVCITSAGNSIFGGATASTSASALVELLSTTGALLLSRLTTTQRDALTAVAGMLIYNSTTGSFQAYDGAWKTVTIL